MVIKHDIVLSSEEVVSLLRELLFIGNNVSQIAHVLDTFKRPDDEFALCLRRHLVGLHDVCAEPSKFAGGARYGSRYPSCEP